MDNVVTPQPKPLLLDPMTPAQLRRTPIVMTPYEVDRMKQKSWDRGFITGVVVTSAWMIYTQYRHYKRARDAEMGKRNA